MGRLRAMLRGVALARVASVALLAACSGGTGDSTPPSQPASTGGLATTTTTEAAPRYDFPPAPKISVSNGFRAEVYASGLEHPTAMAWGPDGRLYATEDVGNVVAVRPLTRRPDEVASGFETPLGLVWIGRTLFVSSQGELEALRIRGRRIVARRSVVSGLPYGLHQQDNVVVGEDGRLYFGSGSTCDACEEDDQRSAAVLSVLPSGRALRIVASGLRNPFGLAFDPRTERLYASVNSRDDLPTPESPEPAEMLVLVEEGADYGFPDCWPSALQKRMMGSCEGVTAPVAYLEAHSSADGLAFYTGSTFPARYRDGVFVALWGQYYATEHGRRVDFVTVRPDGTSPPDGVTPFADGFDHPLALAVDPQGALLVADWGRGVIYRIQAAGAP
jgi:glucose/arabinose dehydrogenase